MWRCSPVLSSVHYHIDWKTLKDQSGWLCYRFFLFLTNGKTKNQQWVSLSLNTLPLPQPACGSQTQRPRHQPDIKELVAMKAECCVASHRLCIGQKLHSNTPQRIQPTASSHVRPNSQYPNWICCLHDPYQNSEYCHIRNNSGILVCM